MDWEAALPAIAQRHGLDPELLRRVVQAESSGVTDAKDYRTGTHKGLMQISPALAKQYGVDPNDPLQNMGVGASELSRLLKKYNNNYGRAVAAYNAGEGVMDKLQPGQLPQNDETPGYVLRVLEGYNPPQQAKAQAQQPQETYEQMLARDWPRSQAIADRPQGPSYPIASPYGIINVPGWTQIQKGLLAPGTLMGPPSREEWEAGQKIKQGLLQRQAEQQQNLPGEKQKAPDLYQLSQTPGAQGLVGNMGLSAAPTVDVGKVAPTQSAFGQGLQQGVSGLTSPSNLMQLVSLPMNKLIQMYFAGDMSLETFKAVAGAAERYAAGDAEGARRMLGEGLVTGTMALGAGHGLLHEEGPGTQAARVSDAGRGVGQQASGPGVPNQPAEVQVAPKQERNVGVEGGPTPVTQVGQTGAQEVTGREQGASSRATASAPIEGGGGTTGTVTPKPSGTTAGAIPEAMKPQIMQVIMHEPQLRQMFQQADAQGQQAMMLAVHDHLMKQQAAAQPQAQPPAPVQPVAQPAVQPATAPPVQAIQQAMPAGSTETSGVEGKMEPYAPPASLQQKIAEARKSGLLPDQRTQPNAGYAGPERRLQDVAREQMTSGLKGQPTPGEQLDQTMREALPKTDVSESQVWQHITEKGIRDPKWYAEWKAAFQAADQRTQGRMLTEIQQEIAAKAAGGSKDAQRPSGVAQAPTATPSESAGPAQQPLRPAQEPAGAAREPLQPAKEPVRVAPEAPKPYVPLPASERPRVSAGGAKEPELKTQAPAEIPKQTPRPEGAMAPEVEKWKEQRRTEAAERQEVMRQNAQGSEGVPSKREMRNAVEPWNSPGRTVDRVLKTRPEERPAREQELRKVVEDVKRQGPEAVRTEGEKMRTKATRAQNMAEWGLDQLEPERQAFASEMRGKEGKLSAGALREIQIPQALQDWATQKGLSFDPREAGERKQWVSDIASHTREAINRALGNTMKEVGNRRELTPEEEKFAQNLESKRDELVAEIRKHPRPTQRQLDQLESVITGIGATRGTRFVAEKGPQVSVDEHGALQTTGSVANREMWNRFLGRPPGEHGSRPSEERIQARVQELKREAKLSRSVARQLGHEMPEPTDRVVARPVEAPKPTEALARGTPKAQVVSVEPVKALSEKAEPAAKPEAVKPDVEREALLKQLSELEAKTKKAPETVKEPVKAAEAPVSKAVPEKPKPPSSPKAPAKSSVLERNTADEGPVREGKVTKTTQNREVLSDLGERIARLPREFREDLSRRINDISTKFETLSERITKAGREIARMKEAGETSRSYKDSEGKVHTVTLEDAEMRLMRLGLERSRHMEEHLPALKTAVETFERSRPSEAPRQEEVRGKTTAPVTRYEYNPETRKMEAVGTTMQTVEAPPKSEVRPSDMTESLQQTRGHLANLIKKNGPGAKGSDRLVKDIRNMERQMVEAGLRVPDPVAGVKEVLEGSRLLKAAGYKEGPKAEERMTAGEVVRPGAEEPVGELHGMLNDFANLKAEDGTPKYIMPKGSLEFINKALPDGSPKHFGPAAELVTKPILDGLKRGEFSAEEAAGRLERSLRRMAEGFQEARKAPAEMQGDVRRAAVQQAVRLARGEKLPAKPSGEAGFLGGRRTIQPGQLSAGLRAGAQAAKNFMRRIASEAERNREAQHLSDRIADVRQMNKADVFHYYQVEKGLQVSPKSRANIYNYREDQLLPAAQRTVSLTPAEHKINDWVHTVVADNTRIIQKLAGKNFTAQDIAGLTHRALEGKGQTYEKWLSNKMKVGSGNVLSLFASSRRAARYVALEDPTTGDRVVVSVSKAGNVTAYGAGQQLGGPIGLKSEFENAGLKFKRATSNEIESAAGKKYFHDAIGPNIAENIALRRAERIHDFVEKLKEEPEFKRMATTNASVAETLGFRRANVINREWLPQFKNYRFEPHVAEVLEKEYGKFQKGDFAAYERASNWLKRSIFWNPLMHTPNIAIHWQGEKGLTGMATQLFDPREWRAHQHAFEVMRDPIKYHQMLEAGLPLMRQPNSTDVTKLFVAHATRDMTTGPVASRLSKAFGYANPIALGRAIFRGASEITWGSHDYAIMQATFSRMEKNGWDLKTAADDVTRHIPNYRMPPRVWNSRALGALMDAPGLSMFSQYHYGAFRSYGEMAKELIDPLKPGDRMRAADRIAALGLITYVLYPQADKLAKLITGRSTAQWRRAGSSTFVYNLGKLYNSLAGRRGEPMMAPVPFVTSVVTPAPILGAVEKAVQSRELTQKGVPIQKAARKAAQIGLESVGAVAGYESGQEQRGKGDFNWREFLYKVWGGRDEIPGGSVGGPRLPRISRIR